MLKARQKEQPEPLRFPEPREGLPEDPRPFLGSEHGAAAAAVQEHLTARCLVAVVGPPGSGKSTVCRHAANSRWARQWFLQDESGHPVHRRFWVDLEDAEPGGDTEERIARAVGRPSFSEALARLGTGRPCLLVLDNADRALGEADPETFARLVACVDRGASIVVTRRRVVDLVPRRPWTAVVGVQPFATNEEARHLFEQLAPRHAADFRSVAITAACDRLPLAVALLARASVGADLQVAQVRAGPEGRHGLGLATEVASAVLGPGERRLWGALSLFPAGLSEADISAVFSGAPGAREGALTLFTMGLAQRCEAGLRIPAPLRVATAPVGVDDAEVAALWQRYTDRARAIAGPVPPEVAGDEGSVGPAGSPETGAATSGLSLDSGVVGSGLSPGESHASTAAAHSWLTRQVATLRRLAARPSLPDGCFELACAGLAIRPAGSTSATLEAILVRLVERSLERPSADEPSADEPSPEGPSADEQSAVGPGPEGPSADEPSAEGPGPGESSPDAEVKDGAVLATRVEQAGRLAGVLEDEFRFSVAALLAAALVQAHGRRGDRRRQAEALCQLGRAERLAGRNADAEGHLTQAQHLFETIHDVVGLGTVLFEQGQVDLERGHLDDAEGHLRQAQSLFEDQGRPLGVANASLDLVRIDLARGRLDAAEQRLDEAVERYEAAGDQLGFANACLQLGQLALARGDLGEAERRFGRAMDGYEQASDKVGFANAFLQMGQVDLARGRLKSAQQRFRGALNGYQLVGDKVGMANASLQLGQIDLARGQLDSAAELLEVARAAYEELGDLVGMANAGLQLGQVRLGAGDLDEAHQLVTAAQAGYDEIGDSLGSANSRQVLAMVSQAQRRPTDAVWWYAEAARLYATLERTASVGWSLAGAADASTSKAERLGYATAAVRRLRQAGLADAAQQLAIRFDLPPDPEPPPEAESPEAEAKAPVDAEPPPNAETAAPVLSEDEGSPEGELPPHIDIPTPAVEEGDSDAQGAPAPRPPTLEAPSPPEGDVPSPPEPDVAPPRSEGGPAPDGEVPPPGEAPQPSAAVEGSPPEDEVPLSEDEVAPPVDWVPPPEDGVPPPEVGVQLSEDEVASPVDGVPAPEDEVPPPEDGVQAPDGIVPSPEGEVLSPDVEASSPDSLAASSPDAVRASLGAPDAVPPVPADTTVGTTDEEAPFPAAIDEAAPTPPDVAPTSAEGSVAADGTEASPPDGNTTEDAPPADSGAKTRKSWFRLGRRKDP